MSWKYALIRHIPLILVVLLLPISRVEAQAPDWGAVETLSRSEEIASSPTLTSDASGTVHAFWESRVRDQEGSTSVLAYTRIQGGARMNPVDIIISPGNRDARAPRAIVSADGRLHLFWLTPSQGVYGPLYHSWAPAADAADSRQWQPPQLIADGTYQSDVREDPDGRLHVVYASVLDAAGICHIASTDHGDTWGEATCVERNYTLRDQESEVQPRLAIDSKGVLHVVWMLHDYSPLSQISYSSRAVFYAHSTDGGTNWSAPVAVDIVDGRVDPSEREKVYRAPDWGNIAVDLEDRVHIVFIGAVDMQRYHQWSADGGRTWSSRQVAIPSGGYNNWQGLAVDDSDRLHLLWPSLNGMEYAWWDGGAWSPTQLLSDVGSPHHAQAAVSLGNRVHVVWQDYGGVSPSGGDSQGRILWAELRTSAPARNPVALPTVMHFEEMAPVLSPEVQPTVSLAAMTSVPTPAPATQSSGASAILIGIAPAALIVVGVVLLQMRKR